MGDAAAVAAAASVSQAQHVGLIGYPGTGKKALLKAMRSESKTSVKWLLEAVGTLRPPPTDGLEVTAALHLSLRGIQPKGDAWVGATATSANNDSNGNSEKGPLPTVAHLLQRTEAAAIMRRFRLPAIGSIEELLRAFAKDKNMKSKKGKEPALESVARRLLAELAQLPGCCTLPAPDAAGISLVPLWAAHGVPVQAAMKALMEVQAAVLVSRPATGGGALEIVARGVGPTVDLEAILADSDDEGPANGADDGMDDSGSEHFEGEEGEEEEEGEESEEEGMDDV